MLLPFLNFFAWFTLTAEGLRQRFYFVKLYCLFYNVRKMFSTA